MTNHSGNHLPRHSHARAGWIRSTAACMGIMACIGSACAQTTTSASAPAGPDTSRGKVLAFATNTGAAAGALSVCNPQAYTAVRLCGILILGHWKDLGQDMPTDSDLAQSIENSWSKAAKQARDTQASASPPQSCQVLAEKAKAMSLWEMCGAARRLDAQSQGNQSAPAQQRQPMNTTPRNQNDDFKME